MESSPTLHDHARFYGSRRSSAQMTLLRRVQPAPIEELHRAVRVRRPHRRGMVSTISLSFPGSFRNAPVKLIHGRFPSSPLPCQDAGVGPQSLLDLSIGGAGKRDRRTLQAERRARPGCRTRDILKVEVPVLRLRYDGSTPTIRRTIRTRFLSSIA